MLLSYCGCERVTAPYEKRFGRIFIVCASGRPPAEMLHILERRLNNGPAEELLESAAQQRQIMQFRLRKWLGGGGMSRISTHVLDTALGRPAAGIMVHLEYAEPSGEWEGARARARPTQMAGARTSAA